jgi:hypothetical protein
MNRSEPAGRAGGSFARRIAEHGVLIVSASVGMLIVGLVLLRILEIVGSCHGVFVYPLDDTYIDLQFAAELARGHYGLTDQAASSPASSVLYPLLLAAARGWFLAPLLVNVAAALATTVALGCVLGRHGALTQLRSILLAVPLLLLLCLALDLVDLSVIGLEHTAHQLVSVLIVIGVAEAADNYPDPRIGPWWLIALCATAALWRFEALGLVLMSGIGLAAVGARRTGLLILAAAASMLAVYFLLMTWAGLPLLPSSVLAKWVLTRQSGGGDAIALVIVSIIECAQQWETLPLIALGIATSAAVWLRPYRPRDRMLVAIYLGCVLGHMAFGAWSWLGRYSPYLFAIGAATLLLVFDRAIRRLLTEGGPVSIGLVGVALIGVVTIRTALLPDSVALSSRNVAEQQYQLRRFAVGYYQAGVAANDIGLLSWGNPYPVLDLWGISDETARRARVGRQPGWMEALVRARGIGLAVIYEPWFPDQIPADWQRVATLSRSSPSQTGYPTVSFFATSPAAVGRIITSLREFQPTLPSGTILRLTPPSADG